MSPTQAKQLATRLSESTQEDYSKVLEWQEGELRRRSEKLQATVELLRLMSSNEMSVRCLSHNNVLTLYCLTEHKLLCVNCTYTESKHRTHRVLPIKDSLEHIARDNTKLEEKLQNDIMEFDSSIRNAHSNITVLDKQLQSALRSIEEHYQQQRAELEQKYSKAVEKVKQNYTRLIDSTGNIREGLRQFKGRVEEALSLAGLGKYASSGSSNPIVQHLCASVFAELGMFRVEAITSRQLNRMSHLSRL